MVPIKTDIDPAPEWLLNFVRCKCKTHQRIHVVLKPAPAARMDYLVFKDVVVATESLVIIKQSFGNTTIPTVMTIAISTEIYLTFLIRFILLNMRLLKLAR